MFLKNKIFKNKKNCRLCNGKNLTKILSFSKIPISEKYESIRKDIKAIKVPLSVYFCKNCTNVQIKEVINPKLLWKKYTYFSGQTKAIIEHFNSFSKKTIKRFDLKMNDFILDIGSNDGSLLKEFKDKRYKNVIGVDPAKSIVKEANKKKIKTYHSFFDKNFSNRLLKNDIKPKIITAFNVFAHSDKMIDFIQSIKKILKKDGIFIFEVQYLKDIIDKKIIGTFFHEHMNHYSVIALDNFFKKNNLFLFDVERVKIQKGSIIGYVCHKNFVKHKTRRMTNLVQIEKKVQLNKIYTIQKLKKIVESNRVKTLKIINKSYKKKIICGYGAARSGALLAINYGIEKEIRYLFDDHKMKINKFSQINSSKVISTNKIQKLKPDLCIILAYLHNKSIIKKNIKSIVRGVDFMVLYPEPKIVNIRNYKQYL